MELVKSLFSILIVLGYQFKFLTRAEDLFENVKIRHYIGRDEKVILDILLVKILNFLGCSLNGSYYEYGLNEASNIKLDANKRTLFYVHGWMQDLRVSPTPPQVINSFLKRDEHNLCVLDFKDLATIHYAILFESIPLFSQKLAFVLQNWIANGVHPTLIHLAGHSMGAHICGLIGRNLRSAGYLIGRITGLDPAGPLYCTSGTPHPDTLRKDDAGFVDVIHTDDGVIGCILPLGVADFYPNKGMRPQPMCGSGFMEFLNMLTGVQWGLMIWLPINRQDAALVLTNNSINSTELTKFFM